MNKTNLYKQIGTFVLMIVVMISVAAIDMEFYKTVLFLFGALSIGRTVGNFARERWPTKGEHNVKG
jgi:hypothetical protein